MITSSSIPYISQMLNDPHSITDADIDSIVSLTETYPYFVPARYMDAASHHKRQPFNPEMMNTMQLYMGNWIVFHDYMQAAHGGEYIPSEDIISQPADVDDVSEDEESFEDSTESIWSQEDDEIEAETDEDEQTLEAEEVVEEEEEFDEEEYTGEPDEEAADIPDLTENEVGSLEEEVGFGELEEDFEEEFNSAVEAVEEEHLSDKPEQATATTDAENDEALILPIYTEDYFLHQGIQVSNNIPVTDKVASDVVEESPVAEDPKSLMVVMSYSDWLMHFKSHGEKTKEEEDGQKALKSMWQKEKLAAALEEENEEIPENVFEMAVNSITKEDGLASESLADIYNKQGKYDAAIDMYKKLSLRNPQKSAYFARKVEEILKEK